MGKKRIQIDVSDEVFKDIENLRNESGNTTAGVLRDALKVYKYLKQDERDSKVILENIKGDKKQLIIP